MNDEELLENIVNQLLFINHDKWAKEYTKDNWEEKSTYSTDIGANNISISRIKDSYDFILDLFNKEYYILRIVGRGTIKYYGGDKIQKKYRAKLRELYHKIEDKLGKITEADSKTAEKNRELLTSIQKALSGEKRLKIVK